MNAVPKDTEEKILDIIDERDDELGRVLREGMFLFESLEMLSDRNMQNLLREIQSEMLLVALKGASEVFSGKVFKNMSSRAADILRDDWHAPRLEMPGTTVHRGSASVSDPVHAEAIPFDSDAELARKKAYAEGHAAGERLGLEFGLERGHREGRAEGLASAMTGAAELLQALQREQARVDARLEDEVLACIDSMARLVLRRELEHDGDAFRRIINRALEQLPSFAEEPTIHLNPDDIALFEAGGFTFDTARLQPDSHLSRGDCRITSGSAEIDAGADAWIDGIVEK